MRLKILKLVMTINVMAVGSVVEACNAKEACMSINLWLASNLFAGKSC